MREQRRARIRYLGFGGTIASAAVPGTTEARPALAAAEVLAGVPGLEELAEIEPRDFATIASYAVTVEHMLALAREAEQAFAEGCDAVVITHGTDTIEETAYALALMLPRDHAVVLTGALRNPTLPSPDGAANLLAACRVAATPDDGCAGTAGRAERRGARRALRDEDAHEPPLHLRLARRRPARRDRRRSRRPVVPPALGRTTWDGPSRSTGTRSSSSASRRASTTACCGRPSRSSPTASCWRGSVAATSAVAPAGPGRRPGGGHRGRDRDPRRRRTEPRADVPDGGRRDGPDRAGRADGRRARGPQGPPQAARRERARPAGAVAVPGALIRRRGRPGPGNSNRAH